MRAKQAKRLRKTGRSNTIGLPTSTTRRFYRALKQEFKTNRISLHAREVYLAIMTQEAQRNGEYN